MLNSIFIIGFALFAIMFGAGNVIFPVQIGAEYGSHWVIPFIGFLSSELLITLWSFMIVSRYQTIDKLGLLVNKHFIKIIYGSFILILVFIFIPRTAATSYEMFIVHYFPNLPASVFYLIYFGACGIFILNPSNILNVIGKYLSPLLILMLFYALIKSFFYVHVSPKSTPIDTFHAFQKSFFAGYQTGDSLATLIPWVFITNMLVSQGLDTFESRKKPIYYSTILSVVLLGFVYLLLTYLGAVASSTIDIYKMTPTEVLTQTFYITTGETSTFILSVIILLACFTTAIGTGSFSIEFFSRETRAKYSTVTFIILFIGIAMSFNGVSSLIKIATPILEITYTMLVLMLFLETFHIKSAFTYRATIYTGIFFNGLDILYHHLSFLRLVLKPFENLPLFKEHFVWLIPSFIVFSVSLIFTKNKPPKK